MNSNNDTDRNDNDTIAIVIFILMILIPHRSIILIFTYLSISNLLCIVVLALQMMILEVITMTEILTKSSV